MHWEIWYHWYSTSHFSIWNLNRTAFQQSIFAVDSFYHHLHIFVFEINIISKFCLEPVILHRSEIGTNFYIAFTCSFEQIIFSIISLIMSSTLFIDTVDNWEKPVWSWQSVRCGGRRTIEEYKKQAPEFQTFYTFAEDNATRMYCTLATTPPRATVTLHI